MGQLNLRRRVPIIKCKIRPRGSRHSLRADISAGKANGVEAAKLICKYVQGFPPLRPLVLVLKRLLKVCLSLSLSLPLRVQSYNQWTECPGSPAAHTPSTCHRQQDDGNLESFGLSFAGMLSGRMLKKATVCRRRICMKSVVAVCPVTAS